MIVIKWYESVKWFFENELVKELFCDFVLCLNYIGNVVIDNVKEKNRRKVLEVN